MPDTPPQARSPKMPDLRLNRHEVPTTPRVFQSDVCLFCGGSPGRYTCSESDRGIFSCSNYHGPRGGP